MASPAPATAAFPSGEVQRLDAGWELASTPGGEDRTDLGGLDALAWRQASVPGTVAGALGREGLGAPGALRDLDAEDWWFRTRFHAEPAGAEEEVVLRLGGIATVAEVYLNGERVLESDSMFLAHEVEVGHRLRGDNELVIRCRALGPLLRVRRKPRARWRTRLVSEGNLRFFRTMLIGRAPGFAPGPAAVGPWRPVTIERRRGARAEELRLRPRLEGDRGTLAVSARIGGLADPGSQVLGLELDGPSGAQRVDLALERAGAALVARGELVVAGAAAWWPHTHGEPALYDARLLLGSGAAERTLAERRVGFRALSPGPAQGHDAERDGLDLHVNGTRVFARGAVWTPSDPVGLAPSTEELRATLERVRDAGMNMLRIPGIGAYESEDFHNLCDELGIMVWQDFMFANLDYPIADADFRDLVAAEARQALEEVAGRPSLAVLCGNSEVEQQVAMQGLDPALGRGELFGELLPDLAREAGADAPYLPSAPSGGNLPFRPGVGIANYFGVGAYLRPLEDARRAEVRFASECLAFANVPDEETVEAMAGAAGASIVSHHPAWKAGVPRDAGSGWDFEDVRDHYLRLLFEVDPVELRSVDNARYLELSRAVSGEVMAEVFGEWRRAGSPCGGGLVLWLRDLVAGAGWGLIDGRGQPKVAFHHLRRALAPVAVWTIDEGLAGIAVHVANDGSSPLAARLRVATYRDLEHRVDEAVEAVEVPAHGALERDLEGMLGRFVDATWAYRFGPAAQDAIVATLEAEGAEPGVISQAMRFPAGRPIEQSAAGQLGLEGAASNAEDGCIRLTVHSRRLAYGVRVHAPGYLPSDDAFSIEPGGTRVIRLQPLEAGVRGDAAALSALNLEGRLRIKLGSEAEQ